MTETLKSFGESRNHDEIKYMEDGNRFDINGNRIFVCKLPIEVNVLEEGNVNKQLSEFMKLNDDNIDSIVLLQKINENAYNYFLYENGVGFTEMCGNGCVAAYKFLGKDDKVTFTSKLGFVVEVCKNGTEYDVMFDKVLLGEEALSHLESIGEYGHANYGLEFLKQHLNLKLKTYDDFHSIITYRKKNPRELFMLMKKLGVENPITYQVYISSLIEHFTSNTNFEVYLREVITENVAVVGGEPHLILKVPKIDHKETREFFLKLLSFIIRFAPADKPQTLNIDNKNTFLFPNQINVMFLENNEEKTKMYSLERIFNGYSLGLTGACGTGSGAVGATVLSQGINGSQELIENTSGKVYKVKKENGKYGIMVESDEVEAGNNRGEAYLENNFGDHFLAKLNYELRESKIYCRANNYGIPRENNADETIAKFYRTLPAEIRDVYDILGGVVHDTGIHETEVSPQEPYKVLCLGGDVYWHAKGKDVYVNYLDTESIGGSQKLPTSDKIGIIFHKKGTEYGKERTNGFSERFYGDFFNSAEKIYSSGHIYRWTKELLLNLKEAIEGGVSAKYKFAKLGKNLPDFIHNEVNAFVDKNGQNLEFINTLIDDYISGLSHKDESDKSSIRLFLLENYKKKLKGIYSTYCNTIFETEFSGSFKESSADQLVMQTINSFLQLDEETSKRKVLQWYQNAFLTEFFNSTSDFERFRTGFKDFGVISDTGTVSLQLASDTDILKKYVTVLSLLLESGMHGEDFIRNIIKFSFIHKENANSVKVADVVSRKNNTRVGLVAETIGGDLKYFILYGKQEKNIGKKELNEECLFLLLKGHQVSVDGDDLSLKQLSGVFSIGLCRLGGGLVEGSERYTYNVSMQAIEELCVSLNLGESDRKEFIELVRINRITADNNISYHNLSFDAAGYGDVVRPVTRAVQGFNFAGDLSDYWLYGNSGSSTTGFLIKELFDHPADWAKPTSKTLIGNVLNRIIDQCGVAGKLDNMLSLYSQNFAQEYLIPAPEKNEQLRALKSVCKDIKEKVSYLYTKENVHLLLGYEKLLEQCIFLIESCFNNENLQKCSDERIIGNYLSNTKDLLNNETEKNKGSSLGSVLGSTPPIEKTHQSQYYSQVSKAKSNISYLFRGIVDKAYNLNVTDFFEGVFSTSVKSVENDDLIAYHILTVLELVCGDKLITNEITQDIVPLIKDFQVLKKNQNTNGYNNIINRIILHNNGRKSSTIQKILDTKIQVIKYLKEGLENGNLQYVLEHILSSSTDSEQRKALYYIVNELINGIKN